MPEFRLIQLQVNGKRIVECQGLMLAKVNAGGEEEEEEEERLLLLSDAPKRHTGKEIKFENFRLVCDSTHFDRMFSSFIDYNRLFANLIKKGLFDVEILIEMPVKFISEGN